MRDGRIEYAFTAQAFVKAYIEAWRDRSKPYFLVIEEINRGNCARIFGDIFQLLDREIDGQSCYTIKPDTDLQAYIAENLNLTPNIPENIASGEGDVPAGEPVHLCDNEHLGPIVIPD